MTDPTLAITLGAHTLALGSNTFKKLYKSLATAGTYYTMEDGGGTDYQVPVGKKFWILSYATSANTIATSYTIEKNTSADTGSGTLIDTEVAGAANIIELGYPAFVSVEAGKYINVTASANTARLWVYGIELSV